MSIRTNPMKAVPLLSKRLRKVEQEANLDDLKSVLINIKDVFSLVKKNEEELLDTLAEVDGYIRKSNIRSSSKTPYRISDLENLKKLEQLSIRFGSEAVIQDGDFESLKALSTLHHLKISWGVSTAMHTDVKIILPPNLEKLHVEGFLDTTFQNG
ncbi:hypothetical protein LR48_Vigan06g086700 [Vigna angularis]|uniref:Uncharacterized protein n=1 Tax=Phaseolus angularis TaxID=3914 RepID=A0A0L9US78_PHAAN|nr:hypothetical protein LR48_Vigan06g086700 [Vigna angularis]